jgi:MarR family
MEALLHQGPLPVNVIGPKVNLTPGAISVAVDRLEVRGLVARAEGKRDRRVNNPRICSMITGRNHCEAPEMSRTVPRLLFLVFAVVAAAQTASDFTARYGYSDAERFVVRPEIVMTAKYTEDRTACEMLIEPEPSIRRPDKDHSMAADTVSKVIDELIPVSERGILLSRGIENVGAAEYQVAEYQNVTIGRYFARYLPANHDEKSATVVRKDWKCTPAIASQKYVPAIDLNAADLHTRYGVPVAQRFEVRPRITLMVAYGMDQAACQMVVEPTHSIIPRDEPAKYTRPEVVDEIIDEVLPDADRGKLLFGIVTKSGCNDYQRDDYQNFTVSRLRHNCSLPNPEIEGVATLTRKSLLCDNAEK